MATDASRLISFFEKASVSLVNRRTLILRLKLLRSTIDVQMRLGSGRPTHGTRSVETTSAGEYHLPLGKALAGQNVQQAYLILEDAATRI